MAASPALPAGTVAFLFTDVQGSTRLLAQHPDAFRAAMRRHHDLLQRAIEQNSGVVFETVGDAVYAAFPRPTDAVAAAVAGQLALDAEPWGDVPIRVRMGVHLGEVEIHEQRYFGVPLYRCARLMSMGHGGQVLLSQATYDLVRDALPAGASVRDLGEHRLRDLPHTERIYQVLDPALPATFPPLRTLEAPPNNLSVQRTPLVGREREVAAARSLLKRADVSLLTLTGPAGTGKTRLALEVAATLMDGFYDGVFFVPLAPVRDPGLLLSAVARTLGIVEGAERPLQEVLMEFLRGKRRLLVLDNFEQILAAAPLVADMLAAGGGCKVLVTSRAALRLYGEHELAVPPLSLPNPERLPPLDELRQYEAVRLFMERAQAIRTDFVLTEANAATVVQICRRLDGLPLAIELAAARVKLLPPHALLARLDNRLALLTSGPQDRPARQRTLRGALDWSYELLTEPERALFHMLAVFVGGWTLPAAEAVGGEQVLDLLGSLVDHSVVKQEGERDGEPRFVMLESLREYAWEHLVRSGEAPHAWRRHAQYFLALAEESERPIHGHEHKAWLERLEQDHGNLLAALRWWAGTNEPADAEWGLRAGGALFWFWYTRGHLTEGRRLLTELLGAPQAAAATLGRAKALAAAGMLAWGQGDHVAARRLSEESLAIGQELRDRPVIAAALFGLALATYGEGHFDTARAFHEQALALRRELGDPWEIALSLHNLARTVHDQGAYVAARSLYEQALAIRRQVGDRRSSAGSLWCLGELAHDQEDFASALTTYREALTLGAEVGDKWMIMAIFASFAGLAAANDQPERALQLAGASAAVGEAAGARLLPSLQARLDRRLEPASQALGQAASAGARASGAAMSLAEAIACALATEQPALAALSQEQRHLPGSPGTPAAADTPGTFGTHGTPAMPLTKREREVATLIARGYTNREIAEALVIGDRTVETHVEHILSKLGLRSRAPVAAWARDRGLLPETAQAGRGRDP